MLTLEAQISLRFTLQSLVLQIIEVFGFPIGYNGEIQKFIKNRKLKINCNYTYKGMPSRGTVRFKDLVEQYYIHIQDLQECVDERGRERGREADSIETAKRLTMVLEVK